MVITLQPMILLKMVSFTIRFANMIIVNIHEHWMRVTCFNPLWVSGITNVIISILKSLVIPTICWALSTVFYLWLTLFFAVNHICSKLPHSSSKLLHFCIKSQHFCSISGHFYVKYKISFKSPFVFHFSTNCPLGQKKILVLTELCNFKTAECNKVVIELCVLQYTCDFK